MLPLPPFPPRPGKAKLSAPSHPAPEPPPPACRFRNPLGSRDWVSRHSFKIHVVVISLVLLVVSVAAVLFALGFIVVVAQVRERVGRGEVGASL